MRCTDPNQHHSWKQTKQTKPTHLKKYNNTHTHTHTMTSVVSKLEEEINVSIVKNNCYICKDIIVEICAEQVLKPGDIISYPLNENTNLNVRVPDIIISGKNNNVLYNKRNEAAMRIQRFWKNRYIRKFVKRLNWHKKTSETICIYMLDDNDHVRYW